MGCGIFGQRPHSTKPGPAHGGLALSEVLGHALPLDLIQVDQIGVTRFSGKAAEPRQVICLSVGAVTSGMSKQCETPSSSWW